MIDDGTCHRLLNMIVIRYIFVFILVAIIACTQEVDIDGYTHAPKLVVNALLRNDQPLTVHLTHTMPVTARAFPTLPDAQVILRSHTEGWIETLSYAGDHRYVSARTAFSLGDSLELRVSWQGHEVTATTTLPAPTAMGDAINIWPAGFDEYGDPMSEYRLQIYDPAHQADFYELFIFGYSYSDDSLYRVINGGNFSGFARFNNLLTVTDPAIQATGLEQANNKSLIFSDQLFNGETYELRLRYLAGSWDLAVHTLVDTVQLLAEHGRGGGPSFALLRTASREYFDYRKAWVLHAHSQRTRPNALGPDLLIKDLADFLFVGDPLAMKGNIQGGVGIFAGYSQTLRQFERRR